MKILAALGGLLILAGILTASVAFVFLLSDDNGPVTFEGMAVAPLPVLETEPVQRGAILYGQHCAECHGKNLEGAANWRYRQPDGTYPAPPHDISGHTWQHPDAVLIRMIANGINPQLKGGMPAFRDKLTPSEMTDVLTYIKNRWDRDERRRQWWQSQTGSELPPK